MFPQRSTIVTPFKEKSNDNNLFKKNQDCVVDIEPNNFPSDLYGHKENYPSNKYNNNYGKEIDSFEATEGLEGDKDQAQPEEESWLPEPFGAFADKSIRKAFIRKVYGILTIQLSFTIILGIIFLSV